MRTYGRLIAACGVARICFQCRCSRHPLPSRVSTNDPIRLSRSDRRRAPRPAVSLICSRAEGLGEFIAAAARGDHFLGRKRQIASVTDDRRNRGEHARARVGSVYRAVSVLLLFESFDDAELPIADFAQRAQDAARQDLDMRIRIVRRGEQLPEAYFMPVTPDSAVSQMGDHVQRRRPLLPGRPPLATVSYSLIRPDVSWLRTRLTAQRFARLNLSHARTPPAFSKPALNACAQLNSRGVSRRIRSLLAFNHRRTKRAAVHCSHVTHVEPIQSALPTLRTLPRTKR